MLRFQEVQKRYRRDRGLACVNLALNKGGLYLFVGENGSGKSTTIKLIARVIFNKNGEGKIENHFQHIVYLPDKRSYPKLLLSYTFLQYYLDKKVPKNKIIDKMKEYALENRRIGSFSKGMLQKLGILQTILSEGDLYLFDEPTDGLDEASIRLFKEDISKLVALGKTVVISTHSKRIYQELKPIIYTFKEGRCNEKRK